MFSPTRLNNRLGVLLLFLADAAALAGVFYLALTVRIHLLPKFIKVIPAFSEDIGAYWWIFLFWLAFFVYEEGYSRRFALWDEVKFLWKSSFFALVAIFTVLFISKKGPDFSRALVLTMGALSLVLLPLIRPRIKKALYKLSILTRKVLIIGSGEAALKAREAVLNEPNLGYEVVAFVDDQGPRELACCKVHRGIKNIERYINAGGIHDVIIAKPELPKEQLIDLINHVQHKAENTLYIPDVSGIAVSGTEIRHFFREQTMMIEVKNNLANPFIYGAKRVIDYTAGVFISIVFLPLMTIIAILVKMDSKGPAILCQKRLGKNAREFGCYKFRTMLPDAEEQLRRILETDPAAKEEYEKYWKLTDDPRITKVGRILRKTSLDELPQILNVLLGEMSLIGPRPYLPREWDHIKEESPVIHALPPGITGLWQVSGRNNQDYAFRITMDTWYVKNWSLWLDVMILFKTIGVVISRDGAR
ncbi:MAG: undecaprenyl-phosphate galactose phosphotransferase [Elusimicrobia bacterium]|nr:MAG: undecaprenyl-phosphate galactose phosphotransferase [Elusimicrobiota bacterium]